jgi:hypothetical protein
MQDMMVIGLDNAIINKNSDSMKYIVIQILLPMFLIIFWLFRYTTEKVRYANLYCQMIQFPQTIIREDIKIIKIVEETLGFD